MRLWNRRNNPWSCETMLFSSLRGSPMRARRGLALLRGRSRAPGSPPPQRIPKEKELIAVVQVRLITWTASIDTVEIEGGSAVVDERVGIVLLLQTARRVERQVVIDELSQVRVESGYPALFLVLAVLRRIM